MRKSLFFVSPGNFAPEINIGSGIAMKEKEERSGRIVELAKQSTRHCGISLIDSAISFAAFPHSKFMSMPFQLSENEVQEDETLISMISKYIKKQIGV
jgi:hypothetical protein